LFLLKITDKQRILFLVNVTFCISIINKFHYKLAVNNFYTFMPRLANMAYS
jgi:hypothetical protein